jgi:hypothetical protein
MKTPKEGVAIWRLDENRYAVGISPDSAISDRWRNATAGRLFCHPRVIAICRTERYYRLSATDRDKRRKAAVAPAASKIELWDVSNTPTRKLKVFQAQFGFYDTVLAAPSQAAARRAWGTHRNLFATGHARAATDEKAIAAALEHPGTLLRRAVGSNDDFALEPSSLPKTGFAEAPARLEAAGANESGAEAKGGTRPKAAGRSLQARCCGSGAPRTRG